MARQVLERSAVEAGNYVVVVYNCQTPRPYAWVISVNEKLPGYNPITKRSLVRVLDACSFENSLVRSDQYGKIDEMLKRYHIEDKLGEIVEAITELVGKS
jgi:hypothetical protein